MEITSQRNRGYVSFPTIREFAEYKNVSVRKREKETLWLRHNLLRKEQLRHYPDGKGWGLGKSKGEYNVRTVKVLRRNNKLLRIVSSRKFFDFSEIARLTGYTVTNAITSKTNLLVLAKLVLRPQKRCHFKSE